MSSRTSQLAELQLEARYKWCFHVNPIDSNQPQINASGKKKKKGLGFHFVPSRIDFNRPQIKGYGKKVYVFSGFLTFKCNSKLRNVVHMYSAFSITFPLRFRKKP